MSARISWRRRWTAAAAAPAAAGLLPAAAAGAADQAFISMRGVFDAAGAAHDFPFTFSGPAVDVTMRTWHYSGGNNAAGQAIPGGSFDPELRLYNYNGTELAFNDDNPHGRQGQAGPVRHGPPAARGDRGLCARAEEPHPGVRAAFVGRFAV